MKRKKRKMKKPITRDQLRAMGVCNCPKCQGKGTSATILLRSHCHPDSAYCLVKAPDKHPYWDLLCIVHDCEKIVGRFSVAVEELKGSWREYSDDSKALLFDQQCHPEGMIFIKFIVDGEFLQVYCNTCRQPTGRLHLK